MGIAIKFSNNETDLDLMDAEYGEEIMSAGWNPDVALVGQQLQFAQLGGQTGKPTDPDMLISDMCQRRMYSYGHDAQF